MAKSNDEKPGGGDATAQAEKANNEVQDKMDEAQAKGYIGSVPDPVPNEAYSLKTGPDAPELVPDDRTRVEQFSAPLAEKEK